MCIEVEVLYQLLLHVHLCMACARHCDYLAQMHTSKQAVRMHETDKLCCHKVSDTMEATNRVLHIDT